MSKRELKEDKVIKQIEKLKENKKNAVAQNAKKIHSKKLGEYLFELECRGYTQTQIARLYGASVPYIHNELKRYKEKNKNYVKEFKNLFLDEDDKKVTLLGMKVRREVLADTAFIIQEEIKRISKKLIDGYELTAKELNFAMRVDENNIKFQLKELDIMNSREMETATLEQIQEALSGVFDPANIVEPIDVREVYNEYEPIEGEYE